MVVGATLSGLLQHHLPHPWDNVYDGAPGTAAGNLAEQAVGAALEYRAYAPVVDQLIKEVGLSGDGLGGLVRATPAPAPANVPAVSK